MSYNEVNKKFESARQNCFRITQINKLTTKIDSNLSFINVCYHLNFPIPIMYR